MRPARPHAVKNPCARLVVRRVIRSAVLSNSIAGRRDGLVWCDGELVEHFNRRSHNRDFLNRVQSSEQFSLLSALWIERFPTKGLVCTASCICASLPNLIAPSATSLSRERTDVVHPATMSIPPGEVAPPLSDQQMIDLQLLSDAVQCEEIGNSTARLHPLLTGRQS
jgi:hypothetical protein